MGIEIDGVSQKLILDSDGDTYLEAATDDTIKVYIAGAHDATISANAINVLSGTTLTIDSGATITNSGTANGFSSADPSSADGDSLGTASAEWSDLYLADGGIIYFGNDQDVTLTHDPDDGLFLKSTATGDDNPVLLTLQTGETDLAQDDVIGKIAFQAPDEGTGTDAILVSGAIQARAEADFSSSVNKTSLDFMTGASEVATTKLTITSDGRGLSQFTAKSWCFADGTGTPAVTDSHNISSLSDHETGQLGMNFANNMASNNYVPIVNAWQGYAYTFGAMDTYTNTFKATCSNGSAYTDVNRVNMLVFGD